MRKVLEIGGFVAAAVLVAFGVTAIVMGVNGRHTVNSSLQEQYIVGTPDMTPAAIKAEAAKAGLKNVTDWPTVNVANKAIDNGTKARAFASYMRIHALEATGGYTYSQMGIYVAKDGAPKAQLMPGGGTDNKDFAAIDPTTKQPISNGARNVWVTETALTTALNTAYMAEQLGLFGIVVGIALLLTGLGLAILAAGGTLVNAEAAFKLFGRRTSKTAGPIPAA
jgi:hypothetical protein